MNKKISAIIGVCFVLLIIFALGMENLNFKLNQKNTQIATLNSHVLDLQNQLDKQQNAHVVTALGISSDPRNVTYPHHNFTVQGIIMNVGEKTAYNAHLDIVAYYKYGVLALNMTLPFGNLAEYAVGNVNQVIATSDWIGNYTVTPRWTENP